MIFCSHNRHCERSEAIQNIKKYINTWQMCKFAKFLLDCFGSKLPRNDGRKPSFGKSAGRKSLASPTNA